MIQDKNYNTEEQNILTPIEFSHSDILLGEEKNAFTDSADDDKTNESPFSSLGDMLDEASRMLNDALNEQMSRQRRRSQNGDAGSSTPFIEKFCTDMTAVAASKDPLVGREKELERQRIEKTLKKSAFLEAQYLVQEEKKRKALEAKKEEEEIQREMVKLRREIIERRRTVEEAWKM